MPWVALAVALVLAGCGGGDDGDETPAMPTVAAGERYPAGVEDAYMASCQQTSGGRVEICRCTFDKIEATVPYEEFEKAEAAIRNFDAAPPATRRKLRRALESCT